MICRSGHLADEEVSASDINNSCQTIYQNLSTRILELIFNKIEMSKAVLTKINKSCLGDDPNPVILYDIILDQLSLNTLQCIIIRKALSHAISNKRCQYHDRGD